jgi:hypothetical protein
MATIFTNELPIDKWLLSENNRIVEFFSDYAEPAVYCDVTIGTLDSFRVYPLPDNSFWVNLRNYLSSQLNDYQDTLDISVNPIDIDTFVKDWDKVLFNEDVVFSITFSDDFTETTILTPTVILGSEQPYNYKLGRTIEANEKVCLSPLKIGTATRYYIKYWDGYPFDIGLTLDRNTTTDTITILNNTNAIETPVINVTNNVYRLVISDGDTTQSLEDYLPLDVGYNELLVNTVSNLDTIFLDFYKESAGCGVYIKWLNEYGGYSYWLFNEFYKVDKLTKSLGSINNDFYNLNDTLSQSKQLGKDSANTWTILSDSLNDNEINIAQGILTSPKVYLFTGVRFAQNNFNDWLEVNVKTSSATIKQPRKDRNDIKLSIELPNDYNIKL